MPIGYGLDGWRAAQVDQQAAVNSKLVAQKAMIDIQNSQIKQQDAAKADALWGAFTAQNAKAGSQDAAGTVQDFADFAAARGGPLSVIEEAAKSAAETKNSLAYEANQNAHAVTGKLDGIAKTNDMIGSAAMSGMQSDQDYQQMKMSVLSDPSLPPELRQFVYGLPQDRQAGMTMLQDRVTRSMQAKDMLDEQRNNLQLKQQQAVNAATIAAKKAATATAANQLEDARNTAALKAKNGGEVSPEALAAKRATTQATVLKNAEMLNEYQPVPKGGSLSDLTPDTKYRAADGSLFVYTKDGQIQWVSGPNATRLTTGGNP